MLFSGRKYVILERPSWKLPSALSENCVSIFIYFCINICFCIKQANKICTLLSSHLLALIVFSVRCFCFTKAYMFSVTHPDTNPAREGLTLVNFSITKLSDAQRARLSTCQPRSQCFSLPIYFLQSFWVQLFASNHMSFQAIYPRLLPWHYNDRQYQNNIVHC